MYMVFTGFCFQYFNLLIFAKSSKHYSYILLYFSIYYLSSILRYKYDVILAIPLVYAKLSTSSFIT